MNRFLKKIPLAALCAAMAAACAGGATDATITVDASKVEGSVTPWLYGACIEDVNHEIYGGLYDQRIFGESFEEPVPNPLFDDCSAYEGEWQVACSVPLMRAPSWSMTRWRWLRARSRPN
jgi:hypothetical protein